MTSSFRHWVLVTLVLMLLGISSCSSGDSIETKQAEVSMSEDRAQAAAVDTDPSAGLPLLEGTATVEMVVNGGTIKITVDGENAPVTAGNFIDLVNKGVYDNLMFHRVVREPQPFVVQGGDPQSENEQVPFQELGTGGYVDPETDTPRYIPLEIKPDGAAEPVYGQTFETANIGEQPQLTHQRGAVAMARSQLPDSASSQFYIALTDLPFLDGSYAVFGYVTAGMETVDSIQQGDRISSAKVVDGLDNLKTDR